MITDDHGQPDASGEPAESAGRTAPDAEQVLSMTTQQAGEQLNVDSRTIRRYIGDGIKTATGTLHLEARQVRTVRGMEWQIYQNDLDQFKRERDRQATEGQTSEQLSTRSGVAAQESQALSSSIQIFAGELERRSIALNQAQETIERLSFEAGRQAGRNEELERELAALRQRVAELEAQAQQQGANPPTTSQRQPPHRLRLLSWRPKSDQ